MRGGKLQLKTCTAGELHLDASTGFTRFRLVLRWKFKYPGTRRSGECAPLVLVPVGRIQKTLLNYSYLTVQNHRVSGCVVHRANPSNGASRVIIDQIQFTLGIFGIKEPESLGWSRDNKVQRPRKKQSTCQWTKFQSKRRWLQKRTISWFAVHLAN